jgi:hypothetical protein
MPLERYTNAYSRSTGSTLQFSDNETPTGTQDGVNATFILAHPPSGSSLRLTLNNDPLIFGVDYTLSGKTITIDVGSIPISSDTLVANYRF